MSKNFETRASLLAKIHIAKKDLGLDDDTYRAMLENLTNKRSAKDLSYKQLVYILAHLRKCGWDTSNYDKKKKAPKTGKEYAPLMEKINALRIETNKSWDYVQSIALRMFNLELSWLNKKQLIAVVTALVKHKEVQNARNTA